MGYNAPSESRPSRVAFGLAAIPCLDCVLNQINTALGLSTIGISPLQIVRGALLLLFVIGCGMAIFKDPRRLGVIPVAVPAGIVLLAGVVSKEICSTGIASLGAIVPYGQMLYWLMLWATVSVFCSKPADALVILKGLAIGSIMTAVSVLLGLVVGTGNFYADDAVRASAGWFETAKMITGVLTTGGIVLLFLGQDEQRWIFPVLAWVDFLACIATYARAGTAALFAALIWLFIWVCLWGKSLRRSAIRFGTVCALICIVGAASISPAQLFSRWNDVGSDEGGGSGRATFWKIALDEFAQDKGIDQIAGRGYSAMSAMLYDKYGDDIKHTHNDGLDMLLVGGVIGGAWLLLFLTDLITRILHCPVASPSRAAMTAIFLIYIFHSQLTGQIWGTDAMTYYTMSLSSIFALRSSTVSHRRDREYSSLRLGSLQHSDRLA